MYLCSKAAKLGDDGHSLQIVCPFAVENGQLPMDNSAVNDNHYPSSIVCHPLINAFRKLHYIYSSQLGTKMADREPTLATSCKTSYDPQPYYNPEALAITVSSEPEDTPEFKGIQEDISDYNYPEEIPDMSVHDSRHQTRAREGHHEPVGQEVPNVHYPQRHRHGTGTQAVCNGL